MDDHLAERYRAALPEARRCFFVSKANRQLAEKQIGSDISNAEVVRNPFNVDLSASPPWPSSETLHLACVARIHFASKGQDVLLEALAGPQWATRNWHLRLYGDGPNRDILQRLVSHFGLNDRVSFMGYVTDVKKIWAENHVLVMPSRFEGLPLAIVEAMLCARPVVATAVGGNAEIVDDGITGFLADAPTSSLFRNSLEKMWELRSELEGVGRVAAQRIREKIPADPTRVFSQKLMELI
jgi:glycosyltransferase involved in cell wall biosynthesis